MRTGGTIPTTGRGVGDGGVAAQDSRPAAISPSGQARNEYEGIGGISARVPGARRRRI
jgi:hypothetical protein